MTPLNGFESGLAQLQNSGCDLNKTVQQVRQDFEQKADEAERRLREKQDREFKKFSK